MSKDLNKYRGSEWSKWDLHLHSPSSFLANEFNGLDIDTFVKTIKKQGLKVVGLTNYFKFADDEIEGDDSIKAKLEAEGITVFPNLEFRFEQKNKDNEYFNFHIIFSNKTPYSRITDLLGRLKVESGEYCKDLSETESEIKKATISSRQHLLETLRDDKNLKHLRDYIIVGCSNGYGGIRPEKNNDGRGDTVAEGFDKSVDAFFSSRENPVADKNFFLNKTRFDGALSKPAFLASDAHKQSEIGGTYSWVKAEPAFSGLVQVLYSPSERVVYSDNKPSDIKSSRVIIDKFKFINKEIHFNPDLNAVIGTRGSGKSVLLKAIAMNVSGVEYRAKVEASRYESDHKFNDSKFSDSQVVWADGAVDSGDEGNQKKVFFIPQGYLSNLAYDENAKEDDRYEFLLSLLRKNQEFKNADANVSSFKDTNSQTVHALVDAIVASKSKIDEINGDTLNLGSEKSIESEIKDVKSKITTLRKKYEITEDDSKRYQDAKMVVENSSSNLRKIKQDIDILDILENEEGLVDVSSANISYLSSRVKDEIVSKIKISGDTKAKEIIKVAKTSLAEERVKIEQQVEGSQKVINELAPKFEKQKELQDLIEKKTSLDKKISDINDLSKSLEYYSNKRVQQLMDLKTTYFNFETKIRELFETVDFETFQFIEINISIHEKPNLMSRFIERNINTNKKQNLSSQSKFFIDNSNRLTKSNFDNIVNDIVDKKFVCKNSVTDNKQVLRELLVNPYDIDFLSSIKMQGTNTTFRDMTGGQKAMSLLELIFRFDSEDYPILIDQPEDDLDASGISSSVVDFVKSQKKNRQIFIASHSGNLVVMSDSEEIITANKDGTYSVGSIEDEKTRKNIVDILEGGDTALKLRLNKLRVENND